MAYVLHELSFDQMLHWFEVAIDIQNPNTGIITEKEASEIVNQINEEFTWNAEKGRFE